MALLTPKCVDLQAPGGGRINNCAQGVPNAAPYNSTSIADVANPQYAALSGHVNITYPGAGIKIDMTGANTSGNNQSLFGPIIATPVGAESIDEYLFGRWNMSGNSSGYPVSSEIVFFPTGSYIISGKIGNLPNGNISPFFYVGNFTTNTQGQTLEPGQKIVLKSNTGIETTYTVSNIKDDSFSAANEKTSEHYTFSRV